VTAVVYALKEAFNNLGRNALIVLGAILAVFISLTLTFGTLVFGEVVRVNTLQWAQDVRVIAFLQDDMGSAATGDLQQEVSSWPQVQDVFFQAGCPERGAHPVLQRRGDAEGPW